jgi:membrane-associated phospholipid phosphatase
MLVGDRVAADVAERLYSEPVKDGLVWVTALGSFPAAAIILAATAAWAVARRRFVDAAVLPFGFFLTWLAVDLAKEVYDRPRPSGSHVITEGMAYPSGHAAYSAAWVVCAVVLVRGGSSFTARFAAITAAVALAAVIGLTRVYLRAHYLSDVEGGWAAAVAIFGLLGLVALVVGRLRHNDRPQP